MTSPLRALACALPLALASCASVPPIETPSGRPECSISGATNDQVQDHLLSCFMAEGWMLRQQTPSQLVLWKENSSVLQNALLGSRYDPTTTHEVRLVFAGNPGSAVRVFGQVALVTNEGSAFEQRNDLTGGQAGHELWQLLRRVEGRFVQTGAPEEEPEVSAPATTDETSAEPPASPSFEEWAAARAQEATPE